MGTEMFPDGESEKITIQGGAEVAVLRTDAMAALEIAMEGNTIHEGSLITRGRMTGNINITILKESEGGKGPLSANVD